MGCLFLDGYWWLSSTLTPALPLTVVNHPGGSEERTQQTESFDLCWIQQGTFSWFAKPASLASATHANEEQQHCPLRHSQHKAGSVLASPRSWTPLLYHIPHWSMHPSMWICTLQGEFVQNKSRESTKVSIHHVHFLPTTPSVKNQKVQTVGEQIQENLFEHERAVSLL